MMPFDELVLCRDGTIKTTDGQTIDKENDFLNSLKLSLSLERGYNFSSLLLMVQEYWHWIKLLYSEIDDGFLKAISDICIDYMETEPTQQKRKIVIGYVATLNKEYVPDLYVAIDLVKEGKRYSLSMKNFKEYLGILVETNIIVLLGQEDKMAGIPINLYDLLITVIDEFYYISEGEKECLMIS